MREINASITKVREAVRYLKSSPNKNQTFMGFVERLGIESYMYQLGGTLPTSC